MLIALALLAVTLAPDERTANVSRLLTRSGHLPFPLSDLVRNLLLFAPLGACLARSRVSAPLGVLAPAALSAFIELTQFAVPGRDPSLRDWVSNATGAALAFAAVRRPPRLRASRLALAAGCTAAVVLLATGVLLAPSPTAGLYYGRHTPSRADLAPYRGTVLGASIDEIAIPDGAITDTDRVRARLGANYALRVSARAGPAPDALAAFVQVADEDDMEILLLGPDRDDLVYHFCTLGGRIGLEMARVRLPRALSRVAAGDSVALGVARKSHDLCFAIDGAVDCGHGFTVGDGWRLLAPDFRILDLGRPWLDAAWLAALFLPLGYWGRTDVASAAAGTIAAAALFLVPAATALIATPGVEIAGAGCGVVVGVLLRRHFGTRGSHPERGAR
jgi:VanZ like family